ncbi:MAG: glycosyltransferase family 4 protein, partial [Acholeplasmataceae bacterium]
ATTITCSTRRKFPMPNTTTPIAITDVLSTMTKEYYHLKYYPVAIYNGVFIEKFQNSVDIKERGISFVSVANFSKNKNQISIVKAALHLINHGVNVDVTFLGEGTEFESVKNFASKTIQPNAFKFEGRVQNVADYLKNSKCLVIPSYYEGNPLSILEAMASGLAVIATNNGGAKDIIEEGINGFLVSPEDSFSLISRMKQIALDKQLLEFISKNNLRKVLEYDMSNVAVKYLDLYSLGNLYVNEKKE